MGGLVVHGGRNELLTVPSSQTVTFVLEADTPRLLVEDGVYPLSTTDGRTFEMRGAFSLWRAADEAWVAYTDVSLTVDGARLTGTARASTMDITLQTPRDVALGAATFVGGPDTTPPKFAVVPWDPVTAPFQAVQVSPYVAPFESFRFSAGEPLPPPDEVFLRSDSGDTLTLRPAFLMDATLPHETAATSGPGALSFFSPFVLFRFADHYRVVVDGLTDFAGNAAIGVQIDTPPAPDLVPQDGFESASVAAGLAGAQVIDGSGLPVISGGKSLYGANKVLDSLKCYYGQVHGTPLLLRLAVPAGATQVTFTYREVGTVFRGSSYHEAAVAFEGGPIEGRTVYDDTITLNMRVALPDGSDAYVGPVEAGEVDLPAGNGDEVVFFIPDFVAGCSDPDPTGLIIDDLRVQ